MHIARTVVLKCKIGEGDLRGILAAVYTFIGMRLWPNLVDGHEETSKIEGCTTTEAQRSAGTHASGPGITSNSFSATPTQMCEFKRAHSSNGAIVALGSMVDST